MRPQLHSPAMALRLRQLLLLPTALAVAIILTGCGAGGGSRDLTGEPFTEQNEMDFNRNLEQIGDLVGEGECERAQQKLDALTAAVGQVPPEIDQRLKDDLIELLGRLGDQIQGQCETVETTTSTTTRDDTTAPTIEETTTTTTTTAETTDTTEPTPPTAPGGGTQPGGGTPPGGTLPGGGTTPGSGGIAPRGAR